MGDQISGTNGQIIPNSIDTTIIDLGYNIDTTSVFLTGFSCNGQETFKHGLNAIYPFEGIIPFNSWITSITNDYNYDSKVPTCICSGDQDASYPNNVTLFNNLTTNEAIVKLNTLIGINHVWSYNNTTEELLECFDWKKSCFIICDHKSLIYNTLDGCNQNIDKFATYNSIKGITII